jgi:hypothetical protein
MAIDPRLIPFRRKKRFRDALIELQKDENFKIFWTQFLRDCNVTKPRFHRDPIEITRLEGQRHLAMSYLSLLGRDDTDYILAEMERNNEE